MVADPSEVDANQPMIRKTQVSLTDYATPASSVSAFCRAAIQKLIPRQFWGDGPDGISNFKLVLRHVDRFIKLRRFESLSLHEVCKGVKVSTETDRLRQSRTDPHR
jgi:telomerase reverse transcriptase